MTRVTKVGVLVGAGLVAAGAYWGLRSGSPAAPVAKTPAVEAESPARPGRLVFPAPERGVVSPPAVPGSMAERVRKAVAPAVAAFNTTPDPKDSMETIKARLAARERESARLIADLTALGPEGIDAMVEFYLAGDTDRRIKKFIAEALASLGEAGAGGLARLVKREREVVNRLNIVESLNKVAAPIVPGTLLDVAETDSNVTVRQLALARTSGRDVAPARLAAIARADEQPEVRRQAAIALSTLRGGAGLGALSALASGTDERVRVAAVDGLARIGSPESIAELSRILREGADEATRREAVIALHRVGGEVAREAIRIASEQDASPSVRSQALASLDFARRNP